MRFELPRVSKCCCCFSLRTGSLIIGYVSMFGAAFSFSAITYSLYRVVEFVESQGTTPVENHTPEETAHAVVGLYISHAYSMMIYLYYLVISILLVVGVHTNKAKLMKFYYWTGLFLLALALVLAVMVTVFLHFIATIIIMKWSLILFYCLAVVRSTYLEMEERNKPPVVEMKPLNNAQEAPLVV